MNRYLLNSYKPALLFALGCLLLITIIFCQWQWFKHDRLTFSKQLRQPGAAKNLFDNMPEIRDILAPKEEYEDIVNFPLFIEGRKPAKSADTSLEDHASDNPALTLTGVMLTADNLLALIADEKKLHYRLKEGDEIQGWKIASVQKDKVILMKNGQAKELPLVNAVSPTNHAMPSYPEGMPNPYPEQMFNNSGEVPYAQ